MCLILIHTNVIALPGGGFLVPFCLAGRLGPAVSQGVGLAVVPCPGGALQCLFMICPPALFNCWVHELPSVCRFGCIILLLPNKP